MVNKNTNKTVLGYWPVSDRIIMLKIQGKPFHIAIVQVYAPTSASTDDEIDEFYNLLESTIDQVKSNEVDDNEWSLTTTNFCARTVNSDLFETVSCAMTPL